MRIIEQSVEYWGPCSSDFQEIVARIEAAGRICYRSDPAGDPEKFINTRLLRPTPPHFSVLEHSNVVGLVSNPSAYTLCRLKDAFRSRWIRFKFDDNDNLYVYGNLRAWMEALDTRDMRHALETIEGYGLRILPVDEQPTHMRRVTVKLTTDRAILAEITRHRDDTAFSVQSQRYVDYTGEVLYIKPSWFDDAEATERSIFNDSCMRNEYDYKRLRESGQSPQHARVVLNNQAATEIVITAYMPQWEWIFSLRRSGAAYPQMIKLMDMVFSDFKINGLV